MTRGRRPQLSFRAQLIRTGHEPRYCGRCAYWHLRFVKNARSSTTVHEAVKGRRLKWPASQASTFRRSKRVEIALRYIHGIGPKFSKEICEKCSIPADRRVSQLTDAEVLQIRETIDRDYTVEGDLRREVADEHQASDGPRLLPRPASPQGPAGPRSAHPHERPHPQGQGHADRRQEEGDEVVRHRGHARSARATISPRMNEAWSNDRNGQGSNGSRRGKVKKREKKNITSGVAHVQRVVQQHDDHHHRRAGQHDRLVVVGHEGLQGFAQVDAVCRADGRRRCRQEGAWSTA